MQDWPPTRRYLMATAPSTAATRSASSKTMNGALPPSSKLRRLICGAAPAMIARPVAVEPVNAIFLMSGWLSSSSWSVRAGLAVTTLKVPGGSPASSAMPAMASAVSGVAGDGFRTMLHPAARAGAILRVTIVAGKFQGVTAATGPTGWRSTQVRLPACGDGTHSPVTRRACSANHPKYARANWTSFRASSSGLPFSVVMRRARTPRRLLHQRVDVQQHLSPLSRRPGRPLPERSVGRLDGALRLARPGIADRRDDRAVGRIDDVEGGAAAGVHPLAIDVHARGVGCHDASLNALRRLRRSRPTTGSGPRRRGCTCARAPGSG